MTDIEITYHPGQHKVFKQSKAKRKFVKKGRRWGFTQGASHDVIQTALKGVTPQLWIDTVTINIDRYVERYFVPILKQLPPDTWKWRQQKKELNICGRVVDMRSADRPENIEGFGYKKITLNEAGIILKNRYLWYNALLPMVMDFDADITAGGTPKGGGALFHDLWTKANDPLIKDWEAFSFTSYNNPFLEKSVIDNLANDMPEMVRKQEIYAEFLESEAMVFRNVQNCINSELKPSISSKKINHAGLDLAKHVDYTVLTILDPSGRQIYWDRWNKLDWTYQKKLAIEKLNQFNASVCIDSTGVGEPIFDDLLNTLGSNRVTGYHYTSESKKQLIENLMIGFEKSEIELMGIDVQTNELLIFTYSINKSGRISYNAPEGSHDDCVNSLALAKWNLDHKRNEIHVWSA